MQGSFNLNASIGDINKDTIFADKHRLNTDQIGKITIQADANNFPVGLLDEALTLSDSRYKGLLLAALGEKMDLNVQESKGKEGIDLKLKISTPLVHGVVNGILKDDRLIVNEPDSIEMILEPRLVEHLAKLVSGNYKIQLKKAVQGQLILSRLNLIFAKQGENFIDFANSTILASFKTDRADFQISQPIGDISLQKLNLMIDAPENSDKIVLTLDSQASRNNAITQISLKSLLNKSFTEELSTLKNTELTFDLKGLPIELLDELLGKSNILVDALGKSVDAQASFIYHETPLLSLKLNSDVLKMDALYFEIGPHIVLMKPVTIDYQLPSSLINNLALKNSSLKMQDRAGVQLSLNKMDIPISSLQAEEPLKAVSNWVIAADLNINQINVGALETEGMFQLREIAASISGTPLANSQANIQAKMISSKENAALYHLLGEETNLHFDTALAFQEGSLKVSDFKAEIKSEKAQANIEGRLENFEKLLLNTPAIVHYNLSPEAIHILGLNNLKLDNASQIHIHVEADKKGIRLFDLASMQLKGLIKIDQVNLYGNAGALQQVTLPWEISAPNNKITLQIKGKTKLNSGREEGSLDGILHISNWIEKNEIKLAQAKLDSQIVLVKFPVAFMEKMSGQEDLIALIGQALNINLNAQLSSLEKPAGTLQIAIDGKELNGQGSFILENGKLINIAGSPAVVKLTLTPDRFQALRKRFLTPGKKYPEILLTEPSQIALNISSFSLPIEQSDSPHWLKASLTSKLTIDNLGIKNRENGRQVWLKDIQGSVVSSEMAKNISFSINGQHNQEGGSPLPFSINGRADNTFKSTGELNTDNLALWLDTKFQKFPVMLLGQFLSVNDEISQKISAVLGDKINAEVHVQIDHLQGPVIANLSGNNGKVSLDAKINKGILTLNKNFHTQIVMTQEFGRVILEDIFPLAKGLIGSDNPLTINVDADGFSMPIKNFDISDAQVGSASLELGKVRFRSDGKLGTILSLFNTSGSDVISVWFTPLYMSMQKGVVKFKRMDMLIMDAYPVATWGIVDLGADKVNMMIGLTGQALVKGFNIPALGKDYILQIPFKGTISNASIDKKKATAKIAAMIASNRGPEGRLIGAALHIAAGGLTEEAAPPPTTDPLPWSTGDDAASPETSLMDINHPLHQVEDKATSILRNLIPF